MHRAVIVSGIEKVKIELETGFRFPQPQQVCVLAAVTEYGGVARCALNDVIRYPLDAVVSGCVGERPRKAAELDGEPNIGPGDLPWISEA